MKYSNIKNLQELDDAQREVHKKLREKEKELNRRYDTVRNSFTPVNLFASGLRSASKKRPYDQYLLNLIRRIREKVSGM